MGTINLVEWLGYLASGLVAISFLMKSINKLRFINVVGAILFVIYGVAIQALPVVLVNLFVVGVNVYHLVRKNAG
ncbi:hypothetical protein [Sporomusa sp.]|uniref:hypothetical protein n=1 Tax=Sporomusa sp. TaxID=2078658 RepID=UPI002BC56087|nr:hypothetical protein [Sporomusa sp.]HWR44971.1 hypothetical protein [Sporomusa sp.]